MREMVNQVLDSGRISYGPFSRQFEDSFAKIHECHYAVLSNSGTSSLQVALQTLKELHGWKDGDRVLVPAVTFVATVNVVLHNNLTPVLVDVDPRYYDINVEQMTKALWGNPNIRCIIPVHLFGQPCDMKGVTEAVDWLDDRDIKVIEDSCETMFAEHYCKPVGAWGDIACFSTYVAHILTTGVGGIATTNNTDYAAKMRSLVNHGRDGIYISIDDDVDAAREVISRRFNFTSIGHSFRITELEAALALAQLETWQENITARQLNAARLSAGLEHLQNRLQLPAVRANSSHSYMMWPIVLREGNKWDLIYHLEERGIETRELLRLTDQPCYRGMWDPSDYPVAKWLNEQGLYLGCHPGLARYDIDYMVEVIDGYFR
jgi:dTDP-4-amino-4,6-dideoxygalactose transaminase